MIGVISRSTIGMVLILGLIFLIYILFRPSSNQKRNINFYFASLWGVAPFISGLNTTIPKLSELTISGKITFGEILVYSTQIILVLVYASKRMGARQTSVRNSKWAIPIFFAGLAFLEGGALQQGIIQPIYCLIIFGASSLLCLSVDQIKASLYFSLILILLGQIIPVLTGTGVQDCRLDKCFISPLIFSVQNAGNGLGISTLLIAMVLMPLSKRAEFLYLFAIFAYVLILSGSRSSLLVFLIMTIVIGFSNALQSKKQKILGKILLVTFIFISTIPTFYNFPGSAFTYRGILWIGAKGIIKHAEITGNGPSFWVRLGNDFGFYANYGTHNIWLDYSVAFGIWTCIVLMVWILRAYINIEAEFAPLRYLLLAMVLLGTVESDLYMWTAGSSIAGIVMLIVTIRVDQGKIDLSSGRD